MPHLYLVAGHGAGDSGAVGNGYTEAEQVRKLVAEMKRLAPDCVTVHPTDDNAFASGAIKRLSIPSDWQIVEEHMNSGPASAKGASVHKGTNMAFDAYDKALADGLSALMPGRSSTLVNQSLANATRARAKGYGYRLIENGFISNSADAAFFESRLTDIARVQLAAFGIFGDACGESPIDWKELPMEYILKPDGETNHYHVSGVFYKKLTHPDQLAALDKAAQAVTGKDMPRVVIGSKEAPFGARLMQTMVDADTLRGCAAKENEKSK